MRSLTFPFRKTCSALPAVAMLSMGVVLSAPVAQTGNGQVGLAASARPAIVVPDIALTQAGTVADNLHLVEPSALAPNPLELDAPLAPKGSPLDPQVSALPAGIDPGSSTPVTLGSTGIPVRALESYRLAATLTASADPGCNIDWALIAAIGRVESNHARFGGNQLDSGAVAQPGIIGIALDGSNETARITDTDGGLLDRDTTFDRAVGPMQFIPGTWRAAGVDADGDGAKNPQDMADAAAATAVYLCSGPGDLSTAGDLHSAILRYNYSDAYVRMVTSIAAAYRNGVSALPASDPAPAASSTASSNGNSETAPSQVSGGVTKSSANVRPVQAVAPSKPAAVAPARSTSVAPARTTTTALARTTTTASAPATTTTASAPATTTPSAPATSTTASAPATSTTASAPATSTTASAPATTTTTSTSQWSRTSSRDSTTAASAPATTTATCDNSWSCGSSRR
jgi:hypothetical protein